jgi:hypothetical protein
MSPMVQDPPNKASDVVQRIAAVMEEVTSVSKDDQFNGGATRYAYRGVDRVVKALSASMRKHKLVMLPVASGVPEYIPVTTSNGKPANMVRILVTYGIYGPEGDRVALTVPGEAMDSSDKAVSKAMSVAWRTALIQAFFLPTEEPDPDSEYQELGEERPRAQDPKGFQGTSAAAQAEKLKQYDDAIASWQAAIEERKDSFDDLKALYAQASKTPHLPTEVLNMIREAGEKVRPQ